MSGCFLVARRIFNSAIWRRDPLYLKIFLWIIGCANYAPVKKKGYLYRRGELCTTYKEIMESNVYVHNNRLYTPSLKKVRLVLSWLAAQGIIIANPLRPQLGRAGADPGADPRAYVGLLIRVINYESYQNLDCYQGRGLETGLSEQGHDREISNNTRGGNKGGRLPQNLVGKIAAQYNKLLCPPLSPVRLTSSGQLRSKALDEQLKQRCKSSSETKQLSWWIGFFGQLKLMPHLMGDNSSGWRANLHWISKRSSFDKILDGNYIRGPRQRGPTRSPPTNSREARRQDILKQCDYLNAISDAQRKADNETTNQDGESNSGNIDDAHAIERRQ
jgi:hypothetical protein